MCFTKMTYNWQINVYVTSSILVRFLIFFFSCVFMALICSFFHSSSPCCWDGDIWESCSNKRKRKWLLYLHEQEWQNHWQGKNFLICHLLNWDSASIIYLSQKIYQIILYSCKLPYFLFWKEKFWKLTRVCHPQFDIESHYIVNYWPH